MSKMTKRINKLVDKHNDTLAKRRKKLLRFCEKHPSAKQEFLPLFLNAVDGAHLHVSYVEAFFSKSSE